jgi:putative spermidine/putrescine transport system substrate-binding protein
VLKIVRLAAVLSLLAGPLAAQPKTLTVAGYGGALETTLRAELIPAFERRHGVRVDYLSGNSAETLARLSGADARAIDVAIADDWAIMQAVERGFCGRIAGLPADQVEPQARIAGDRALALGLSVTGIAYDPKFFSEKGWAPPQSWNDLADAKYRKLLVMPSIASVYGLQALVMLARANGGGEQDIDPGFRVMKESIAPNVLAFEDRPWTTSERLAKGEARLAVWSSGRTRYVMKFGGSLAFVSPREGAPVASALACPTAKAEANALASAFVTDLLQPVLQDLFARDFGYVPAARNVPAPGPAPGPALERLVTLDWKTINAQREAWTARWKRDIDR